MLKQQLRTRYGAWKINTAQSLIFLIALGSAFAVYNAYQEAHLPPPPSVTELTPPARDPRLARYTQQMSAWKADLQQQQMTATWPYLGQDYVARVDLPDKVPVTLSDWDDKSQAQAAQKAYQGFVAARRQARIPTPEACIVHVFDATGTEVVMASASGIGAASS